MENTLQKLSSTAALSAYYSPPSIAPKLLSVTATGQIGGWKRTTTYKLINEGKLVAKKLGAKTLITAESLEAFIASLPNKDVMGG